jgi:hypothetical protein
MTNKIERQFFNGIKINDQRHKDLIAKNRLKTFISSNFTNKMN